MASRFDRRPHQPCYSPPSELSSWLNEYDRALHRVLLIPPDGTRAHSMAGPITNMLYHMLQPAEVKILPALGTHTPMTLEEKQRILVQICLPKPTWIITGAPMQRRWGLCLRVLLRKYPAGCWIIPLR